MDDSEQLTLPASSDKRSEQFLDVEDEITQSEDLDTENDVIQHPCSHGEITWVEKVDAEDMPIEFLKEKKEEINKTRKSKAKKSDEYSYVPVTLPNEGNGENILDQIYNRYVKININTDNNREGVIFVPVPDDYDDSELSDIIESSGGNKWEISALNGARIPIERSTSSYQTYLFRNDTGSYMDWCFNNDYLMWDKENEEYIKKDFISQTEKRTTLASFAGIFVLSSATIVSNFGISTILSFSAIDFFFLSIILGLFGGSILLFISVLISKYVIKNHLFKD